MIGIVVSMALVACPAYAAADHPIQVTHIEPVDDASKTESFLAFRSELLRNIAKDIRAVLAAVSADVQVTLEGRKGIPALRAAWHLDENSKPFLDELRTVLLLGGRYEDCAFVAPFVWTEFPSSLFPTDYVVVTSNVAALRSDSSAGATEVRTARKGDLLKLTSGRSGWFGIALDDGRRVFVQANAVRRPNSFRAYFSRIMSKWRLVGFFQGVD